MWYDYAPLFPFYDLILVAAVACAMNVWDIMKAFPKPPEARRTATITISFMTGKGVGDKYTIF